MPFKTGIEGKENRTYKLNKTGAKIATYHKLAIIVNVDTFEIVKYGELEEMRVYLDENYYEHRQLHRRTFRYQIYFSDEWLPEALERMIDKKDIEFTTELSNAYTEGMFIEDEDGYIGEVYHCYTINGDPPLDHWKDIKSKRDESAILTPDQEQAEKRRQRSLKAADTMRRKREEAKNQDGQKDRDI